MTRTRARWLQLATCVVVACVWFGTAPEPQDAPRAKQAGDASSDAARMAATLAERATAIAAGEPDGVEATSAGLGLSTIEVIVSRNDTLERIFRRLQLNMEDLASLRTLIGQKAQLDRLRPGEALKLIHRDGELFGLERQLSVSETLKVVREEDGFKSDVLENPIERHVRTVRGTINQSLFGAVTAAGAHDQTALALAEIFAWDIDFVLDIRSGDSFVVTYEELRQDGKYIKDGPILAAEFVNAGREYRAVRYEDPTSGQAHYYTPDGRTMRKAFLRAPLEFSRVSSRFNLKRRHPILNTIRAHKGVDYAAPMGTPIRASGDGRVVFAGVRGGYGNVVEIAHSGGVATLYAHLAKFAPGIRSGRRVSQGSVIGYVGKSGLATGPHLHYEYRVKGMHKDPQSVILPEAPPIDDRLRPDFLAKTAPLLASLETPLGPALVAR